MVGSPEASPQASPQALDDYGGQRYFDNGEARDPNTFNAEYDYDFQGEQNRPYLYISPSATVGTYSNLTRTAPPSSKSFQGWVQSQYRWDNYGHAAYDAQTAQPKDEAPGPQLSRPFNTGEAVGSSTKPTVSGEQATMRSEGKLVLATVGLPARGKTYIAKKLQRHLTWLGMKVGFFNVGNYRYVCGVSARQIADRDHFMFCSVLSRKIIGSNQSHDFFDPANQEAVETRR